MYIGIVKDQLKTMEDRKTKKYDTYKEAHDAAEKLCEQTMGDRGTIDVEQVDRYYIDYGTGAGNEWVEGTLEDAKKAADEGAAYTQSSISVLDGEKNVVASRTWWGVPFDPNETDEDEDDILCFGQFGHYGAWQS